MVSMNRATVAIFALFLTGCVAVSRHSHSTANSTTHARIGPAFSDSESVILRYRVEKGAAILDSDRVTLVFPNLPDPELNAFNFQGGALAIQISGDGFSEATVNCQRNEFACKFNARYQNGTNQIEFFGRRVQLVNAATTIIVGDKSIDNHRNKICVAVP